MKTNLVGIQNSLSVGTYSKTQTSVLGVAYQKTINGQNVLGPALNSFIDTTTLTAIPPSLISYVPTQNLLFVLQNNNGASLSVLAFSFNNSTGATSYIGRVILNFANSAA